MKGNFDWNNFLGRIHFGYIFAIILVIIIGMVIWINPELTDSAKSALGAINSALSATIGYLFGIHQVDPVPKQYQIHNRDRLYSNKKDETLEETEE